MTGPGQILKVDPEELDAAAARWLGYLANLVGSPPNLGGTSPWASTYLASGMLVAGTELATGRFAERMTQTAAIPAAASAAFQGHESDAVKEIQQVLGMVTDTAKGVESTITDALKTGESMITDAVKTGTEAASSLIGSISQATGSGGQAQPLNAHHLDHGGAIDTAVGGADQAQPQDEHHDNHEHGRAVG